MDHEFEALIYVTQRIASKLSPFLVEVSPDPMEGDNEELEEELCTRQDMRNVHATTYRESRSPNAVPKSFLGGRGRGGERGGCVRLIQMLAGLAKKQNGRTGRAEDRVRRSCKTSSISHMPHQSLLVLDKELWGDTVAFVELVEIINILLKPKYETPQTRCKRSRSLRNGICSHGDFGPGGREPFLEGCIRTTTFWFIPLRQSCRHLASSKSRCLYCRLSEVRQVCEGLDEFVIKTQTVEELRA